MEAANAGKKNVSEEENATPATQALETRVVSGAFYPPVSR